MDKLTTIHSLQVVETRLAALDLSLENHAHANQNLLPFLCDVTNPKQVQSTVDEVVCKWGGVDILINNFSSGVGFTGMPNMVGYTSTKGAIESMTRTLALEYTPQGIVFNVMHPPLTRTKSAVGFGVPVKTMAERARRNHN